MLAAPPSAIRLAALESHVARLTAHVASAQQLCDEFSGVELFLGAPAIEAINLQSHLAQCRGWLAEYRAKVVAERQRLESERAQ